MVLNLSQTLDPRTLVNFSLTFRIASRYFGRAHDTSAVVAYSSFIHVDE